MEQVITKNQFYSMKQQRNIQREIIKELRKKLGKQETIINALGLFLTSRRIKEPESEEKFIKVLEYLVKMWEAESAQRKVEK